MLLEYKISENEENLSVKDILKKKLKISNRLITKLKLNKKIFVDNDIAFVNDIPKVDSVVKVYIDFEEEDNTIPEEGNLEILYEDEYFLAINKPADMVVHPCSYHLNGTLANYVKYYLNTFKKIRPINRLDNGTSGIVLFAKNEYVQEAFKNLEIKPIKEYLAVVYGLFDKKEGTISLPIARKPNSIIEREVNFENGQESITHYTVIKEDKLYNIPISIIKVQLETGRTHQIRVHMSHLGHALVGDTLYIDKQVEAVFKENNVDISKDYPSQALHAYKLTFIHPVTDKKVEIIAPVPISINRFIK